MLRTTEDYFKWRDEWIDWRAEWIDRHIAEPDLMYELGPILGVNAATVFFMIRIKGVERTATALVNLVSRQVNGDTIH